MNTRTDEERTLPALRKVLPVFEQNGLMHERDMRVVRRAIGPISCG